MVIQIGIIPGVAEEYYEKNVAELRIVLLCLWVLEGRQWLSCALGNIFSGPGVVAPLRYKCHAPSQNNGDVCEGDGKCHRSCDQPRTLRLHVSAGSSQRSIQNIYLDCGLTLLTQRSPEAMGVDSARSGYNGAADESR